MTTPIGVVFCWLFLFNLIQRFRRVADRRAKRALTATFDVFACEMRSSRPQVKLANLERGTSDKFVILGVALFNVPRKMCFAQFAVGSQEKRPFSNGLFSIQSEGLVCNLTAGEYVIAAGVWHHASACIFPSD